jgi:hypothetical protein
MSRRDSPERRLPLAAALAIALLAGAADAAPRPIRPHGGAVIPVTSCADDGSAGTLREAVRVAASGDTVDLGGLACAKITLASGAIVTGADDLTIAGPGASRLTIDAAHASRVVLHGGAGTLEIDGLTLANGSYTPSDGFYGGGCLASTASISLGAAVVTGCSASAPGAIAGGAVFALGGVALHGSAITESSAVSLAGYAGAAALGGAIFAFGEIVLDRSLISGNSVTAPAGSVYGGGVVARGGIRIKYSTVHANSATTGDAAAAAYGGGLSSDSGAFVEFSTFDGNSADAGGGIDLRNHGYTSVLISATVSGNHARAIGGGMLVDNDLDVEQGTIASNESGPAGGGGIVAVGTNANFQSTIIADNAPDGAMAADLDGTAYVTGANDLIETSGLAVPPGTLMLDPALAPLAANGGATRTHALLASSPAIDMGNNVDHEMFEQRGPGFPREVGAGPDIGAYELDPGGIFGDGFDATIP